MSIDIYKIKDKIVDNTDIAIPITTLVDIEKTFLARVEIKIPKAYNVKDENGNVTVITPELNINKFYPNWDKEIMIFEEIVEDEKITNNEISKEQQLENYKKQIISLNKEIFLSEQLLTSEIAEDTPQWSELEELKAKKSQIIELHKEIAFKINGISD